MDNASRSSVMVAIRRQWQPVINNVVAACRGDARAAEQIKPFLKHLSSQEDWRDLTAVLRRILDGEREAQHLVDGLDPTDSLIAGHVLDQLGVDLSSLPSELVAAVRTPTEGDSGTEMSLVDFISMVVGALRQGTPGARVEELKTMTQAMAHADDSPESLRALGGLLHGLLHEQPLDLKLVPPEFSQYLQGALASLLAPQRPPAEA
ncbi:MAG: hypothetical protein ABIJ09_06640 [Pseudomonadota bacterium]